MNDRELQFCSVVEQEYLLHGNLPTYERVDTLMHLTRKFYERCLTSEDCRKHLEEMGVPIRRILGASDIKPGALSIEQLRCVNKLLDFNDTRSDKKKLEEIGVPSWKYQTWKKDPAFQAYIRERANNLIGDNIDEVDRALLDNARSGDISSIKLIYELTGKYNPRADGQVDVRAILTQVQEIIMRRVKDPETIAAIASDFQLLASTNRVGPRVIEAVEPAAIDF